jgi:hypothetical protein
LQLLWSCEKSKATITKQWRVIAAPSQGIFWKFCSSSDDAHNHTVTSLVIFGNAVAYVSKISWKY